MFYHNKKLSRGWARRGEKKTGFSDSSFSLIYGRIRFLDPVASFSSLLSGHSIDQLRMLLGQNKVSRKKVGHLTKKLTNQVSNKRGLMTSQCEKKNWAMTLRI